MNVRTCLWLECHYQSCRIAYNENCFVLLDFSPSNWVNLASLIMLLHLFFYYYCEWKLTKYFSLQWACHKIWKKCCSWRILKAIHIMLRGEEKWKISDCKVLYFWDVFHLFWILHSYCSIGIFVFFQHCLGVKKLATSRLEKILMLSL